MKKGLDQENNAQSAKSTIIAKLTKSESKSLIQSNFLNYPNEQITAILRNLLIRMKSGHVDLYDGIITVAALFNDSPIQKISDVYMTKKNNKTGHYSKQALHKYVITKTIKTIQQDIQDGLNEDLKE